MKKVMLIVPNLQLGGQERVAVNTAEILSKTFDVTLITFDNSEAAYKWNGNMIDIKVPAKPHIISKIINVLKRVSKVKKIKKELGVDYSISFGESANIVNSMSKYKDKVITSIHGYANLFSRPIDKYIYGHSDKVICCSKEIKAKYDNLFTKFNNSITLYNPYDICEIRNLGLEPVNDIKFTDINIISHGRLEKVKNYSRLIKAFSLVKEKIYNAELIIIGEGSERNRLEELVRKLNIEASVHLIGFRKNPFAYIAKSDLYVLSSLNEGFPNALVEGMALLPVIAVDCKSGPREILNEEVGGEKCKGMEEASYGILVSQTDETEFSYEINEADRILARAIIDVLNNREKLELSKRVAAKRAEEFSFDNYEIALIRMLEEI